MRDLSKHRLALVAACWSIVFAADAGAQGTQRKERPNPDASAQERRDQERLTERHRQLHAASRGQGLAFGLAHPVAERTLPHQKERLQ